MRVLVACEFSGIVRDAFLKRGHDAWSCDLLPTERPGPHIQGDVRDVLGNGWDLMIAHPPCTYLSYAGMAHWNKPGRAERRREAVQFFLELFDAPVSKVCVENPFGLPCQSFRRPDQVINPFDFGEPIRKRTCLWLRGLPILFRSDDLFAMGGPRPVPPPAPIYIGVRKASGKAKKRYTQDSRPRRRFIHWVEGFSSNQNRAHERSRFFPAIADAMAEQWGGLPLERAAREPDLFEEV